MQTNALIQYSADGTTLKKCSMLFSGHLNIPNGVKTIDYRAFENCCSLKSVTIPSSVIKITDYAFAGCRNLKSIVIPNGVTQIGRKAFTGCEELSSIITPESVEEIGERAFYWCHKLSTLILPDNASSKVTHVFWDLVLGGMSSLPTIDDLVYAGTFLLTRRNFNSDGSRVTFSIKDGTRIIGPEVFSYSEIVSITIPESVIRIGARAFDHCSNITNIKLPKKIKHIEDSTFSCSSLKSIVIPGGVQDIGRRAFYYCESLESISIPSSVTSIGPEAFMNCTKLTSIKIPQGVQSIDQCAFCNCKSLESISIPSSVTSIGPEAFSGCTKLTSIMIPQGVKRLSAMAFSGCTNLEKIQLPDSLNIIDDDVFAGCDKINRIIVSFGQRDKFIQFKALEKYKFIIEEENNSSNQKSLSTIKNSTIKITDGKSLLVYYAGVAEKENNIDLAISLYEDADKLGSIEGAYRLGVLLFNTDYYKAYFYIKKAADMGYDDAIKKLNDFSLNKL